MNVATDRVEAFLRAEEEAYHLVDELAQLKKEIESYKIAHEALDEAAGGVSRLANQLTDIAGQLGGVVEALRSIGTPELLRGQEAVTREVTALQRMLEQQGEIHRKDISTVKEDMNAQFSAAKVAADKVRNLTFGTLGLVLITLALVSWLALSLAGR